MIIKYKKEKEVMKQYKPIVVRIVCYKEEDILTESVEQFVGEGKGQGFNAGWIFGEEE